MPEELRKRIAAYVTDVVNTDHLARKIINDMLEHSLDESARSLKLLGQLRDIHEANTNSPPPWWRLGT